MSSSSSTTYSPITIFHGLGVIEHSKTPITEPSPLYGSTTLQQASISTSLLPDHAIPSLFRYIIVVTILTVLPGPYSRSTNFRRWTNLTSILIVISFRLEQQASSFLWLDVVADWLHLHEISRQLCRDHHQPYELFQEFNWIHDG